MIVQYATYHRQPEMMPISISLRPSSDLFIGTQVVPRMSATIILEPPPLKISDGVHKYS